LVVRRTYTIGQGSIQGLSDALKLSSNCVEAVFRELRAQQAHRSEGMSGNDYNFVLTKTAARSPWSDFRSAITRARPRFRSGSTTRRPKSRGEGADRPPEPAPGLLGPGAPDRLLDQLGPAIISQSSIFLYGPTGSGKTSLAERMLRVYQDAIWFPTPWRWTGRSSSSTIRWPTKPFKTRTRTSTPRWVLRAGGRAWRWGAS